MASIFLYFLSHVHLENQNSRAEADLQGVVSMWSTVRTRSIAAEHSHEVFSWYLLLPMFVVPDTCTPSLRNPSKYDVIVNYSLRDMSERSK